MWASLQEWAVIPDSNTWAVQLAVGTEGFTSSDEEVSSLYFASTTVSWKHKHSHCLQKSVVRCLQKSTNKYICGGFKDWAQSFHFVWYILIFACRPPQMELWVTYRQAGELGQLKLLMRWTQWSRQSDFVMAGLRIWIIRVWSIAPAQRWRRTDFSRSRCRTPANVFRLLLSEVLLRWFTVLWTVTWMG